eukprot:TRINITY_DN17689_c0_g1_i1.p1 TRINITY_DN17689_c0_g1~~TRINITY_DN17689_c0_g1_i1.p1  ORF type:complete len:330 (+),score=35.86 TRINITY_DN17689_c0_g1_i1:55-990(+)
MEILTTCSLNSGKNAVIRIVRLQDKKDVVEMSHNIYAGLDYLPVKFERWCEEKKRLFLCAEIDGKAVAVWCYFIIEHDTVALEQAVRVRQDYRGQGISKLVSPFLHQWLTDRYPALRSLRAVTSSLNTVQPTVWARDLRRKVTEPWLHVRWEIESLPALLEATGRSISPVETYWTKLDTVADHIGCPDWQHLFPTGYLCNDWEPFYPTKANVLSHFQSYNFLLSGPTESPTGFSLGDVIPKMCGAAYYFFIFADNWATVLAHLHAHLIWCHKSLSCGVFGFGTALCHKAEVESLGVPPSCIENMLVSEIPL